MKRSLGLSPGCGIEQAAEGAWNFLVPAALTTAIARRASSCGPSSPGCSGRSIPEVVDQVSQQRDAVG